MTSLDDEFVKTYFKKCMNTQKKVHLLVSENGITKVDNLQYCLDFRVIDLRRNMLQDIGSISSQTNLTHLYLQNNELLSLRGFNMFQSLEVLYLDFNKIEVIENLSFCPLKKLSIKGQKLREDQAIGFDPLCMTNLKDHIEEMNVASNKLVSIHPLRYCRHLKSLDISSNGFTNSNKLSQELSEIKELLTLNVLNNPVMQNRNFRIDVIFNCKNLKMLNNHAISKETRHLCEKLVKEKSKLRPAPLDPLHIISAIKESSEDIPITLRPLITSDLLKEMKRKQVSLKK